MASIFSGSILGAAFKRKREEFDWAVGINIAFVLNGFFCFVQGGDDFGGCQQCHIFKSNRYICCGGYARANQIVVCRRAAFKQYTVDMVRKRSQFGWVQAINLSLNRLDFRTCEIANRLEVNSSYVFVNRRTWTSQIGGFAFGTGAFSFRDNLASGDVKRISKRGNIRVVLYT